MRADPNTARATTRRPEVFGNLWTETDSGAGLPEGTALIGVRLHRCQRGSVSLLVLFMGLVFYALAAMTWNTGEITAAKIEAQTAADSAAYTSAVWVSRSVNMVTATNQLALRDASAMGVAAAVIVEGTWVLVWQTIYFAQSIAPLLSGLPFTLPALLPLLSAYLADLVQWIIFVAETGWPIMPGIDLYRLGRHLGDLMDYQRAWVAELPGLIAATKAQLEAYYDCDLRLLSGRLSTSIAPPLHRGTPLTCLIPLTARFAYDALASGSWYQDEKLKLMVIGRGRTGWLVGSLIGYGVGLGMLGFSHHVLSSQPRYSPLEFGPYGAGFSSSPSTWADFTVMASARKRTHNDASRQLPRYPLRFMAPGVFGDADALRPVACAQAETFNGIDGLLSTMNIAGVNVLQPIVSLYPWRVWTDWGWQWQPRLTRTSLIHPELFRGMGVKLVPFGPEFHETVPTH